MRHFVNCRSGEVDARFPARRLESLQHFRERRSSNSRLQGAVAPSRRGSSWKLTVPFSCILRDDARTCYARADAISIRLTLWKTLTVHALAQLLAARVALCVRVATFGHAHALARYLQVQGCCT